MAEHCFPPDLVRCRQDNLKPVCARKEILNQLEKMVRELEQTTHRVPKIVTRSEGCYCGKSREQPYRLTPTVTVNGQEARPYHHTQYPRSGWCPEENFIRPPLQPQMGCYCPLHDTPEMCPPQETPPAVDTQDAAPGLCCNCEDGTGEHLHHPPPVARGRPRTCSYLIRSLCTSGCSNYMCPPPPHAHWSPPVVSCRYPGTCSADCLDHPATRDWSMTTPNYRYYIQPRSYRPF